MYLKRYTIASLILMVLVGWYVYAYVTHESLSLNFFGVNLPSISIALLVVLPMFVLYIASVLHMAFYSMVGGFRLKKYEKDYEKLIDAIADAFLAKDKKPEREFRTARYKLLGKIVDNSKVFPQTEKLLALENEKLRNIIELIHQIKNGEVVNLKKLDLPSDNPLVVQNNINRYKTGELSAEEILINSKNYTADFLQKVFMDFIQEAESEKIMKYYKDFMTKEALFDIIARVVDEKKPLSFSADELYELITSVSDLSKEEYIVISKTLSKGWMPEERLKLFEKLSEKDDKATEAYLYTAFDLEMIELADEILDASSPEEYANFRAYKALKECNQNYNIDIFI